VTIRFGSYIPIQEFQQAIFLRRLRVSGPGNHCASALLKASLAPTGISILAPNSSTTMCRPFEGFQRHILLWLGLGFGAGFRLPVPHPTFFCLGGRVSSVPAVPFLDPSPTRSRSSNSGALNKSLPKIL